MNTALAYCEETIKSATPGNGSFRALSLPLIDVFLVAILRLLPRARGLALWLGAGVGRLKLIQMTGVHNNS